MYYTDIARAIRAALEDRPEGWAGQVARIMVQGGLSVADPDDLEPVVARVMGPLPGTIDDMELDWAIETILEQSPVLADRAALAICYGSYEYPRHADMVAIDVDEPGRTEMVILSDGSAIVGYSSPRRVWEDALVEMIEEALTAGRAPTIFVSPLQALAEAEIMAADARWLARTHGAVVAR